MDLYSITVYRNLEELRKIQDEREVNPFIFGNTKDNIECCPEICIDISALIHLLLTNKSNIESAYMNLANMTEDTLVIVEENLADKVLELLPFLFDDYNYYFEEDDGKTTKCEEAVKYKPYSRQKIYQYNNAQDLNKIVRYAEVNNIPIATFSRANGDLEKEFEQFNSSYKLAILDLTSMSYAIEANKALIYLLEQFLNNMPNIKVIAQTKQIDILLKYFPLFFDGQEAMCKLIPELSDLDQEKLEENKLIKVTDLQGELFDNFIQCFNHNLIGHQYFKERLQYVLKNFLMLNRAEEQKVLSIFLYGKSGIGKTEVARLFANGLQDKCYLAKINFQNYSSQDALNSLIGSPAGYVGCEHGELSDKIKKSKVGVLLCDEFEKTTRPVFSFFLELLEDGRFTDSMTREYDLDGYVIIFTSNIPNGTEYKKIIPPELQTRFDLVCEFEEPTAFEKKEFLNLLLERAKSKYSEQFTEITMTEDEKQELFAFDYAAISALRDIKRVFNNRLMDYFAEKGVL